MKFIIPKTKKVLIKNGKNKSKDIIFTEHKKIGFDANNPNDVFKLALLGFLLNKNMRLPRINGQGLGYKNHITKHEK